MIATTKTLKRWKNSYLWIASETFEPSESERQPSLFLQSFSASWSEERRRRSEEDEMLPWIASLFLPKPPTLIFVQNLKGKVGGTVENQGLFCLVTCGPRTLLVLGWDGWGLVGCIHDILFFFLEKLDWAAAPSSPHNSFTLGWVEWSSMCRMWPRSVHDGSPTCWLAHGWYTWMLNGRRLLVHACTVMDQIPFLCFCSLGKKTVFLLFL